MTIPLSIAARLARVTALRTVLDGGSARFHAGTLPATPDTAIAEPPLATVPLTTPTSGAVADVDGLATLTLTPVAALASAMGQVAFVRLADASGNGVMDLPAGLDTDPEPKAPAIVNTLNVFAGGEVSLLSCVIDE